MFVNSNIFAHCSRTTNDSNSHVCVGSIALLEHIRVWLIIFEFHLSLSKLELDWIICNPTKIYYSVFFNQNRHRTALLGCWPFWIKRSVVVFALPNYNWKAWNSVWPSEAMNRLLHEITKLSKFAVKGTNWRNTANEVIVFSSSSRPLMAAIKPNAPPSSKLSSGNKINTKVWFYSLLLTLQYGAQPLISKRFTRFIHVSLYISLLFLQNPGPLNST